MIHQWLAVTGEAVLSIAFSVCLCLVTQLRTGQGPWVFGPIRQAVSAILAHEEVWFCCERFVDSRKISKGIRAWCPICPITETPNETTRGKHKHAQSHSNLEAERIRIPIPGPPIYRALDVNARIQLPIQPHQDEPHGRRRHDR